MIPTFVDDESIFELSAEEATQTLMALGKALAPEDYDRLSAPTPDADGWIEYREGDPVPSGRVEVKLQCPFNKGDTRDAAKFCWDATGDDAIVAYRHKPQPAPKKIAAARIDPSAEWLDAYRAKPARKDCDMIARLERWQADERVRARVQAQRDWDAGISRGDRIGIDRAPIRAPEPVPEPVSSVKPAIAGLGVTWSKRGAPIVGGDE